MTAPDPTAGEPRPTPTVLHDWACSHDPCSCMDGHASPASITEQAAAICWPITIEETTP